MAGPLKNARHERFAKEYLEQLDADNAALAAGIKLRSSPAESGYYVYFLIDGRSGSIFYVGKGKGNRWFQHRKEAFRSGAINQVKARRIIDCGHSLREVVFADGLDEPSAYEIERQLIRRFRHSGLLNISSGSVHPLESQLAGIDRDIALIRPWSEWIAKATQAQIDATTKLSGSPDEFYVWFVVQYRWLRSQIADQLNSIRGNSNGTAGR